MRPLSGRSTAACGVPKADIAHGVAKRKPITSAYVQIHPVNRVFFADLDVDCVVRDLGVLGEGADMFPPIAALSKPEASASFACQFRHGRLA
jgi:hypothetical protein